jgi:hypothetical protein
MDPAAISARPAITTTRAEDTAPESPTAGANGAAVFIAAVGDTLPGHYHAVRISRASVEFEDMSTGVAAYPPMKIQGPLSKRV